MKAYDHKKLEKKWQKEWAKKGIYRTKDTGKKTYVLDMFPYPSGEGLHVGHPKGYIATDIYSRFKRMQGRTVLHPMGWDAFGLPAENFAIKNKVHPRKAVEQNIKNFKSQLANIGFDYDWTREINTTDPAYYKWTQWIFLKLYEHGLAFQSNEPINWCPSCQTGLANEDLDGNACERCGSIVEKRAIPQWVLKITAYADRMLQDLDLLQWPEHIKEQQRNWIGRSEGAEMDFPLEITREKKYKYLYLHGYKSGADRPRNHWYRENLEALGHTVIIPELPNSSNPREEEQVTAALEATEWDENTIVVGHSLGGIVALKALMKHGKNIAGLVLIAPAMDPESAREATGLPDAGKKPFHRTFDWNIDFSLIRSLTKYRTVLLDVQETHRANYLRKLAQKLDARLVETKAAKEHFTADKEPDVLMWLRPTIRVFTTRPDTIFGATYLVLAPEHPWMKLALGHKTVLTNNEDVAEYVASAGKKTEIERQENRDKTGVKLHGVEAINPATGKKIPVFVADYVLGHYGTGAIMAVPAHDERDFAFAQKFGLSVVDVIARDDETKSYVGEGSLINSGAFNGRNSNDARAEIAARYGMPKVSYKLKDWVFSRQRYWGEPIPIIHCADCGAVPVPYKDLPVKLPDVKNYAPTGTGESPLAGIEKWVNVKCPTCKKPAKRETNTMPQWAGSSWYYLRFMDPKNKTALVAPKKEKQWAPVDVYVGGDHAVRHLIYARFWHKFLYDIKTVSTKEPFARLEFLGFILAEDGRKMSKRYGNVINPNDIVERYGADSLRVYEMFMGPFTDTIAWNTNSMIGSRRFIERVWRLQERLITKTDAETERILHMTIKKAGDDIESFKFNTAISQMMIFVNAAEKTGLKRKDYEIFLKTLAPFAPHVTEEIWRSLGNRTSVHLAKWPIHDAKKLVSASVTIVIQVNGKTRAQIVVPAGTSEKEVQPIAAEAASKWLDGASYRKIVFVPDRLINFVI